MNCLQALSAFRVFSDLSLTTTLKVAGNQMRETYARNICDDKSCASTRGHNCPWQPQPSCYRPRGWDPNSLGPFVSKYLQAPTSLYAAVTPSKGAVTFQWPPLGWVACHVTPADRQREPEGGVPPGEHCLCNILIACPATATSFGIHCDRIHPNEFIW